MLLTELIAGEDDQKRITRTEYRRSVLAKIESDHHEVAKHTSACASVLLSLGGLVTVHTVAVLTGVVAEVGRVAIASGVEVFDTQADPDPVFIVFFAGFVLAVGLSVLPLQQLLVNKRNAVALHMTTVPAGLLQGWVIAQPATLDPWLESPSVSMDLFVLVSLPAVCLILPAQCGLLIWALRPRRSREG